MNQNNFAYLPRTVRRFGSLLGLIALLGCQPDENVESVSAPEPVPVKRVALFQYADSPLHTISAGGILEGLKAKGFSPEENFELTSFNAMRKLEMANSIAQKIAAENFDLILTTGTQALQTMTKANQDGSAVQVFGLVANPFTADVGLNAEDHMDHPRNLVGVGSFPPVDSVFRLAKELYPDLKVAGVVWNSNEINSREGTERARTICSELGIELLESNADSPQEVGDAATDLVAQGAQFLWIGVDNTIHHAAVSLIGAAREGGVPVLSSLPGDAKRGALIDMTLDWHEVGKEMGAMAGDILAGVDPGSIAITEHLESPDELKLILNEAALDGLTAPWSFPEEVLTRADEVVEADN